MTEHNVGSILPCVTVEIGDNSEIIVNGTGTGDQGELRDGKLTITGRLKDLIIRGGFNISPVKIEEAVRKVEGVRDAAVVGLPDEFWGERIVLFSEGGEGWDINGHCRDVLPQSHWPDRIEIVDKLPRNAMGKVLKGELKSMIVA
jgi:acyl-CoA synthetase (AMP-forming)/AMP-acid ligase II